MVLNESIKYWPALSKRQKPEWISAKKFEANINANLYDALIELYEALDNDLNMLAANGIRTSFDIAAKELGIDPEQPFKFKLEKLVV